MNWMLLATPLVGLLLLVLGLRLSHRLFPMTYVQHQMVGIEPNVTGPMNAASNAVVTARQSSFVGGGGEDLATKQPTTGKSLAESAAYDVDITPAVRVLASREDVRTLYGMWGVEKAPRMRKAAVIGKRVASGPPGRKKAVSKKRITVKEAGE